MAFSTFAAAAVCVLVGLLWLINPSYGPNEPRPISHTFPVLGHGLHWLRDRRGFFEWGDRKSQHKPFSVLIGGRKHYVFGRPADVTTLFRKAKVLSIAPFVRLLNTAVFGMPSKDADRLSANRQALHEIHTKYLLRPEHYSIVVLAYHKELDANLQNLARELDISKDGSVVKDGFAFILDVMGTASAIAYFGRKPLEVNPRLLDDMREFVVRGLWPLLGGTPSFLLPEVARKRDQIKSTMTKGLVEPFGSQDDVSSFVAQKVNLMKSLISKDGMASDGLGFLFGLTSNSIPTAYITLLHLLTMPGLLAELRRELDQAGLCSGDEVDMLNTVPDQLPRLRACYQETLRLHNVSASVREVLENTTVTSRPVDESEPRTYTLKSGAVVNMPSTMLHFDESVNPDPDRFNPKRFLAAELGGMGQNPSTTSRPFGGGVSYCPGRIFAERQIMGFLAVLLSRFDVSIANDSWVMPRTAEFDDVAKCPPAQLVIRRR